MSSIASRIVFSKDVANVGSSRYRFESEWVMTRFPLFLHILLIRILSQCHGRYSNHVGRLCQGSKTWGCIDKLFSGSCRQDVRILIGVFQGFTPRPGFCYLSPSIVLAFGVKYVVVERMAFDIKLDRHHTIFVCARRHFTGNSPCTQTSDLDVVW